MQCLLAPILLHTPLRVYLAGLGVFLIFYSLYALLRGRATVAPSWASTTISQIIVGALGGFTGPVAAFPGAFTTIWCGLQSWDKQRQRALYQPYILVMQIAGLMAVSAATPDREPTGWLIQYVPPALAGAYIGLRVFNSITTQQFNKLVSFFLLAAGMALTFKAF